jgi:Domain of unknown function (DUF4430)
MSVTRLMNASPRAAVVGCAAVLCGAALAGCGLGAGPPPTAVTLVVTRDFGASTVRELGAPRVRGQETVASLLARNATVSTRYGGAFVQSIEGLAGGQQDGRQVAWFYYVNGVLAPKGAASTNVNPGDHIWWDRHDFSQADSVPAVVGSFPEPFLNGVGGKRLPVRIECADISSVPCRTVSSRLEALGVLAARAAIGPANEPETLRVVVGPWSAASGAPEAGAIAHGPGTSGVYVRFTSGGHALQLLDERGAVVRTLGAGAGLVAATRYAQNAPVWVISGTDDAGVQAAAQAFGQADLRNHFALVLAPGGARLAAPAPR